MSKIGILQLSARADVGGGPKNIHRFLSRLNNTDFRNAIACPQEGPFYDEYQKIENLAVISVPMRKIGFPTFRHLCQTVKDLDIDIVHSHGRGAGVWSRGLRLRFPKLKVVHTMRGIHYRHYGPVKRSAYLQLERFLSRLTDAVVHVSNSEKLEASNLRLVPADRQFVIPNGIEASYKFQPSVDVRQSLGIRPDHFVVISVVRYSVQKNIETTLNIIKKVQRRSANVRLVIVGGEDDIAKETVVRWIDDKQMSDYVILAGPQNNIYDWLASADAYLSTSLWEGLPTSVLEAMASQLPIVASNVVGNCEVVNNTNGFLVATEDEEGFVDALTRLANDPDLRRRLGANGKRLVEDKYSIESMVSGYESLYRQLAVGR